jgi:peptidoglycan/LPS O-acetylase OafA/YrhL
VRAATHSRHTPPPRYRGELDGLRALAALLLITYHAGMGSLVGGHVGVDVFLSCPAS